MSKLRDEYGTLDLGAGFIAGVEYEIEALQDIGSLTGNKYGFMVETDHSLRNNGHEFKTGPLGIDNVLESFQFLHKSIVLGKNPFSERTSIHVHVNVGDLTQDQAKNLVLTYAMLEPLFFRFAGEARQNNIFCVPLHYTLLPAYYSSSFPTMVSKWHKYTAFNILPVKSLGTFEFRHLGGTGDFNRFATWVKTLKSLYDQTTQKGSINILEYLGKDGDVYKLAQETVPLLTEGVSKHVMDQLLYDSLLDVKLASGGF